MKSTAPENFDGDAATDRLDPTWKAQVDLSRLDRPDSHVYLDRITIVTWCHLVNDMSQPEIAKKSIKPPILAFTVIQGH